MAAAVADALSGHRLVIAVGSFRSEEQRRRFRDIGTSTGARVTTLRIVCPIEMAAQRVRPIRFKLAWSSVSIDPAVTSPVSAP